MSQEPLTSGFRLVTAAGLVLGTAACLSLVASCGTKSDTETPDETVTAAAAAPAAVNPVERGRYLVTVGACNDCHTPFAMGPSGPAPDMTRMLSGHPHDMELPPPPAPSGPWMWGGSATNTAFYGPWGISYSANLTPDEATGIGSWTEEWFIASLRTGKHWGSGRDIMPPMPWAQYAHMTDEDVKAIFAYLRTVPPIENAVPPWTPPAGGMPGETEASPGER